MRKQHGLTPPNRSALWTSLMLTKKQLADLCGLTVRQVSHWTSRGYLATAARDPNRYGGDAIDLCILIKQGRDQGLSPRKAATQARAYLAAEQAGQPSLHALDAAMRAEIQERLRQAAASVGVVLETIEPLAATTPIELPRDG